jgi:hypothetical protein
VNYLLDPRDNDDNIVLTFIGKEVWVGWPHLVEAKVRAVSTARTLYSEPTKAANPPGDWNTQVYKGVYIRKYPPSPQKIKMREH